MAHYIIGAIIVLVGVGMVLKTEWLIENFGSSAWAEDKFGTSGGSRMFYKLIGIGLIFIGFMLVTNLFQGFLEGTIGKLLVR
ncbi:MAG: hypothetical protein EXS55_01590 [Candidatus Magasanikbacteria bacterium]|nr:hypothetical protein [Candidatus Magasanikbacteria bacterium]